MTKNQTTNVVVGRFQNPTLTEDQKDLLNYSISTSAEKPTVVLGLSPLKCTAANPLDYEARKSMIETEYPGQFNFKYIKDQNSDEVWSKNFDTIVSTCSDGTTDIKILGSKDGFYNHYTGEYRDKFEEHVQTTFSSTTCQAKNYSQALKQTPEWRTGVAFAVQSQYPTVYPTVDCAIFDDKTLTKIYLARKKDEPLYRFVGGFASPDDDSFEESAIREAYEETNLECDWPEYIRSFKIDDYRYRNEQSKIITHLFLMVKLENSGRARPQDDINELKLFKFEDLKEEMFQEEHRKMFKYLRELINIRTNKIS